MRKTPKIALIFLAGLSALTGTQMYDEYEAYQAKLREMAERQIREHQSGESTYKVGVDFETNQPVFRLMEGRKPDARQRNIAVSLATELELYSHLLQVYNPDFSTISDALTRTKPSRDIVYKKPYIYSKEPEYIYINPDEV